MLMMLARFPVTPIKFLSFSGVIAQKSSTYYWGTLDPDYNVKALGRSIGQCRETDI